MRLAIIIGLVAVTAALAADVQAASDSFFHERYCSRRASGRLNCAYKTLEQCHRVFEELGEAAYCIEDPWWRGPREEPKTQKAKSSRGIRQ